MTNFALTPYLGLVVEIDGGNDGIGELGDLGKLLLLGMEPSFVLHEASRYSITLSMPMEIGLDLDSYHETITGIRDTFGYFQLGTVLSTSLPFMPKTYGTWSMSFGGYLIVLGGATEEIGRVDFDVIPGGNAKVWLRAGISLSF